MNGDGLTDIITGPVWYQNPGGDLTGGWQRHDLGRGLDAMIFIGGTVYAERGNTVYAIRNGAARKIADLPVSSFGHASASQGYLAMAIDGGVVPMFATEAGTFYLAANGQPVQINSRDSEEGIAAGDIDGDGIRATARAIGSGR